MRKALHRFGKFYSTVMMNIIGIVIFVGILSVVSCEHGWIPNKDIYAISQFVYSYVIPIMIAYASGNQIKRAEEADSSDGAHAGGAIAVMAEAGLLVTNMEIGIFGAMLLGPCCGFVWKRILEPVIRKLNTELEMLLRNLLVAGVGCVFAVCSFYIFAPVLAVIDQIFMRWITFLVEHKLIMLLGLIIEPAKVFFLNNSIHHGMLLPLGMQQAVESGESILFLLETNPGPGLGVLVALFLHKKDERKDYATSIFAHFIGGIHEVYFPQVLSNIWLLLALIAGGTVGNLYFSVMQIGAVTAISPGSIITFLLVCMETSAVGAFVGVLLSAAVSMGVASYILYLQKRKNGLTEAASVREEQLLDTQILQRIVVPEPNLERKMIRKVGFVCDAGVGSSAMGAALFRRKLQELLITEVEVSAYAIDQMPEDLDFIICQKNFKELLMAECLNKEIYTVESLLNQQELSDIVLEIKRRRDEEL